MIRALGCNFTFMRGPFFGRFVATSLNIFWNARLKEMVVSSVGMNAETGSATARFMGGTPPVFPSFAAAFFLFYGCYYPCLCTRAMTNVEEQAMKVANLKIAKKS